MIPLIIDTKTVRVLDALTKGLGQGESRKIDNSNGTYMAVHVERLHGQVYSIAHYYVQNGDMVCDPDMTFLRVRNAWLPLTFEQGGLLYQVAVELDDQGRPRTYRPGALREQIEFARTWMANIAEQQGI